MKSLTFPFVIFLIFSSFSSFCQHEFTCQVLDNSEQNATSSQSGGQCEQHNISNNPDRYSKQQNFIPADSDPVKVIKINFHSIQKENDPENFEDIPAHRAFLDSVVYYVDWYFRNLLEPDDPKTCVCGNGCYIEDTRFRVELVDKYFHEAESHYTSDIGDFFNNSASSLAENDDEVLNVFLIGNGGQSYPHLAAAANLPSYSYLGKDQYIAAVNFHQIYQGISGATDYNLTARNLATNLFHELGHSLGLLHLYTENLGSETDNPNSLDFLTDWFGTGVTGCPKRQLPVEDVCCSDDPDCTSYLNWMGNECGGSSGTEATPMQIGRSHRNSMLSSVRKYIKETTVLNPDHVVSQDETWNFDIRMYSNVVVKSGAKLTIKCKVHMPAIAKIQVEDGAVLEVDGGEITSWSDDRFWQGVEVEGISNKSQFPNNGVFEQGIVRLKNQAIISNAHVAVNLMKGSDWNSTGGIIDAKNSTFLNCRKGVAFFPFDNFYPGNNQSRDNLSLIYNCSFLIDEGYPDIGQSPMGQVTLFGVDGGNVSECVFENKIYSDFDGANQLHRGWGIYLIDSKSSITNNEFKNWSFGVTLHEVTASRDVAVENNSFNNCHTGLSTIKQEFPVINKNTFISNNTAGAHFEGGFGFEIEENEFRNHSNRALSFNWIPKYAHQAYLNDFIDNEVGINAQNSSADNTTSSGLYFKCNDFDQYTYSKAMNISSGSIKRNQGSCNDNQSPAGNLFSNNSNFPYIEVHVHPNYPGKIQYFHHDPSSNSRVKPTFYNSFEIQLHNCGKDYSDNSCISNKTIKVVDPGGDMGGLITEQQFSISEKRVLLDNSLNNYDDAHNNYQSTIDGGSTIGLLNDISSSSFTISDKKQMLIDESPYLSDTIIAYAITNLTSLSENDINDVLLLNSPLNTIFLEQYESQIEGRLTSSQFDNLMSKQNGLSSRDSLKIDVDFALKRVELHRADLLRAYSFDTSLTNDNVADSIIHYLKDVEYPGVKEVLVKAYWETEQWNKADSLISDLSNNSHYSSWSTLQGLIQDKLENGEPVWEIATNETYHDELLNWASDSSDQACWIARGLLASVGDTIFAPHLDVISSPTGKRNTASDDNTSRDDNNYLIWPNPTSNRINVKRNSSNKKIDYQIYTVNGKEVSSGSLSDGKDYIKVETLPDGIYLLTLTEKSRPVKTFKIIIQH